MSDDSITLIDGIVLAVMIIAFARGAFIGMIRESFSIAAVGLSCIALRYGNPPAARALTDLTGGEIGTGAAPFLTGAVILFATVALVGYLGRFLKEGAQNAGLGWADRLGGSAVGVAEGALVATVIVMAASFVLGEDHDSIKRSRSVEMVASLQEYVATNYPDELEQLPDVAAPLLRE
ncbi:MAG: CvpA family protein [Myxococcota bacterium]|jgi:uncharacterized membrane protein required for colicin V production|nr:CvpA family protein [Myxococcota bacterium]